MICKLCGRDVECEICEPFCICCEGGVDSNPKRGKSCVFPVDCHRFRKKVK